MLATRNRRAGLVGVSLLGLIAAVAAVTRPTFQPLDVLPSLVAAVVGVLTLRLLLTELSGPAAESDEDTPAPGTRRRGILIAAW